MRLPDGHERVWKYKSHQIKATVRRTGVCLTYVHESGVLAATLPRGVCTSWDEECELGWLFEFAGASSKSFSTSQSLCPIASEASKVFTKQKQAGTILDGGGIPSLPLALSPSPLNTNRHGFAELSTACKSTAVSHSSVTATSTTHLSYYHLTSGVPALSLPPLLTTNVTDNYRHEDDRYNHRDGVPSSLDRTRIRLRRRGRSLARRPVRRGHSVTALPLCRQHGRRCGSQGSRPSRRWALARAARPTLRRAARCAAATVTGGKQLSPSPNWSRTRRHSTWPVCPPRCERSRRGESHRRASRSDCSSARRS